MPIVPQGRVCTHCGEWKPASEFKRVSGQPHKLRAWCKPCAVAGEQRRRDQVVARVCADCGTEYQCRKAESKYCDVCGTARRFKNLEQGPPMQLICEGCGRQCRSDSSRRRFCSFKCYNRYRWISKFEKDVLDVFESLGFTIDRQARRGRWNFDGAIAGSNVLIEADGTYWHSLPAAIRRDAKKNQWCKDNGYKLLRVPEKAFRDNPIATVWRLVLFAEAEGLTCTRVETKHHVT